MYYTIGTSILSASTMFLGIIMDKYGCRLLRLIGIVLFFLSTIMFAFISFSPQKLSVMVAPAVACNGIGGIIYVFTSFQLGNCFPKARSTVVAVMIGSYNASSTVYTAFLMLYQNQSLQQFALIKFMTFCSKIEI